MPEKAKHYGISRLLDNPVDPAQDLVLQYELKLSNGLSCGGACESCGGSGGSGVCRTCTSYTAGAWDLEQQGMQLLSWLATRMQPG